MKVWLAYETDEVAFVAKNLRAAIREVRRREPEVIEWLPLRKYGDDSVEMYGMLQPGAVNYFLYPENVVE